MSSGLIVGYVFGSKGKALEGAVVTLLKVTGTAVGSQIGLKGIESDYLRNPIAKTNSRGYFQLGFTWSGTDIGEAIGTSGKMDLSLVTSKTVGNFYRNTDYLSRDTITGYLVRDVIGPAGLTTSVFQSIPDLLGFGKDLLESYRKVKAHPLFKADMLSSESYLILAGTYLTISSL